ncbi:hypothetical protein N7462_005228 [Penicillium macrosclerotiorum]|uniref:uncharacterized protein n=1 Tax=Penicillium macrosclerotiorum TaxID=303699 RepID=UPI002547997C|nr:uncharacterized protein N7462_005228 [Penicillium macrosclerotiorum]KAJ5690836.1 hypothetical protein N7462_005228 [Penicillium macrosclerotiorum]
MISDGDLYRLAIFLGSCAMMMIVLYHFLDVNAREDQSPAPAGKPTRTPTESTSSESAGTSAPAAAKAN